MRLVPPASTYRGGALPSGLPRAGLRPLVGNPLSASSHLVLGQAWTGRLGSLTRHQVSILSSGAWPPVEGRTGCLGGTLC